LWTKASASSPRKGGTNEQTRGVFEPSNKKMKNKTEARSYKVNHKHWLVSKVHSQSYRKVLVSLMFCGGQTIFCAYSYDGKTGAFCPEARWSSFAFIYIATDNNVMKGERREIGNREILLYFHIMYSAYIWCIIIIVL
jgi:hypothetical protein